MLATALVLELNDEGVRRELAPFDRPQLFVPIGETNRAGDDPRRCCPMASEFLEHRALGADGRPEEVPLGRGLVPWFELLVMLTEARFDGWLLYSPFSTSYA